MSHDLPIHLCTFMYLIIKLCNYNQFVFTMRNIELQSQVSKDPDIIYNGYA